MRFRFPVVIIDEDFRSENASGLGIRALADAIEKCSTDKDVKETGIEWCIEQSKELKKAGVPCLHYYTMGNAEMTCRIAEKVF